MLCVALPFAVGCGKRAIAHAPAPVKPAPLGWTETGTASWYGVPYMRAMTAAHRTLPFNTWLEVTNLTNGKQVNVRVTDRGPFVDGRIIDLSMGAAERIEMIRSGIAKVKLKVIRPPNAAARDAVQATSASR
jgi:rare lipoprotein A